MAPDLRGHGDSTRVPRTVATAAFVEDVAAWLGALGLEHASLVGHSFGGLIAFLTTARHPELVERLVVAEASPSPAPGAEAEVGAWFESWPVPFPDEEAAIRFFGGGSLRARAWAGGLEEWEDGLWPRFDAETLLWALREAAADSWDERSSIRRPTLVVRGERGLAAAEAREMVSRLDGALLETVPGAGHDVHLERPAGWRRLVEPFLAPRPPGEPPTGAGGRTLGS